ncbi:MAG: hypothetical protein AAF902_02045 [Chloroflexota bacterium]
MKKLIISKSFSGVGFTFAASEESQEVPDEVAAMAISAGFAVEMKPAKRAKKPAKKATKKAN